MVNIGSRTTRSLFILWATLAVAFTSTAWAQDNSVSTSLPRTSPLTAEVGYQIHSLPLVGSQLVGPTVMVRLSRSSQFGARYLLSPENRDDRRMSVFTRLSYGRKSLQWIFEPQYSYLSRTPEQGGDFSTTGLAGGVNYQLTTQWFLGSLVGLEQSGSPFPFGAFWNRPVVIVFTQLDF